VTQEQAPAAPKANPAPLGLAGFALTTLILSLINSGVAGGGADEKLGVVVGLAFAYGGLGQLIAGYWEFRNGNSFAGVAFSSYGGFWVSFAIFVLTGLSEGPNIVAWYLLAWGVFTFYMWIATLKGARDLMITFLLLWITFVVLAIGGFNGDGAGAGVTAIGGYVGILTAIAAFYTSARQIINEVFPGVLPS
jgi:uncharacterized protein